jgi:hypothetical protein
VLWFDGYPGTSLNIDQGVLESGLFMPPEPVLLGLIPLLNDGVLNVKITKGGRIGCDDIYFDASMLIVLIQVP